MHKSTTRRSASYGYVIIQKGVGDKTKKADRNSPRLASLAAKLIKGQSIYVRENESDKVRRFTYQLMKVAINGGDSSRRRLSSMLRDDAATRVLFEDVVPKLAENTPFEFKTSLVASRRVASRTAIRLIFDDKAPKRSIEKIRIPKTKIDVVAEHGAKKAGLRVHEVPAVGTAAHSSVSGQRWLATVDGPVGVDELCRIGARLHIPVRSSNSPDHWTLGLSSLSTEKNAPILLRIVRRPNDLAGVEIELAWHGKGPSKNLVDDIVESIVELQTEFADAVSSVRINPLYQARGNRG